MLTCVAQKRLFLSSLHVIFFFFFRNLELPVTKFGLDLHLTLNFQLLKRLRDFIGFHPETQTCVV